MRLFRKKKVQKLPVNAPKRRILFVSHEASRTGAPKIILNILKHFRDRCDICCESLLHDGGPLMKEFHEYSHLVDCLNHPRERSARLQRKLKRIVQRDGKNIPLLAICNSMESRFIAEELAKLGVPVISLLHELPSSYKPEDYNTVFSASQKVVFPIDYVYEAAAKVIRMPVDKATVMSQGLLDSKFGQRVDRDSARTSICEQLGLPIDSFLVLGCGTLDLRKGIDHFAAVARRVAQLNHDGDKPIHFVWVGGGPTWTHSAFHYVQLDLQKSGAARFVHFVGEQDDTEPYFVASDAFFMSSRVDPFPCVIHEAMASQLPVVTFADSGGAQAAVRDGAGFVVPYGDCEKAANLFRMLADQPHVAAAARKCSLERVHSEYRFEDYGNDLIGLCESIIGQSISDAPTLSNGVPKLRIAA
jgi:glycosyltransferase involved in cell wall biosynthesis